MATFVFNIARGRVAELYRRVKQNDPGNSVIVIVPLLTAGLESDAVLADKDTLADVLAGATDEQTTMGRKVLTDADLAAFPAPDDTNDRMEVSLPSVTWTAASGGAIAKLVVCYDPDSTTGTDADLIPLTCMDFVQTPSGSNITMTGGVFYRASA